MTKDEALKMCLEYIETDAHERKYVRHAIKKALAQPEQEPEYVTYAGNGTAGFSEGERPTGFFIQSDKRQPEPEYLAFMDTPKRTWIELTDEEISASSKGNMTRNGFARTIEAKLKEKNGL